MILVQSGLGGHTSDEQRRPSLTIQCTQLSTDRPFNACNCCSRKLARMSPPRTLTTHREHLYLQIRFAQWQAGTVSDHIQQPVLTPIFQNSKILSTLQITHYSLSTIHCPPFTVHYSLSTIHCPLFTVHHSLSTIHCPLFTVHYSLSTIHCPLATEQEQSPC